jgi:radical SAM superfamily enzyme YgiQ (UPF0313 family)
MKVILVNPVIRPQDPPFHIPFGIATLSRIADQLGHEVGILDLNAHRLGVDAFREELKDADYKDTDVIGIGGLSSQYRFIKPLLPVIKQVRPDALLVAGNGLLTTLPEETMKLLPQIDVGIIGEGERTFTELLDVVDSKNFSRVKGLIYREDGELVRTPYRPLIENLDEEVPWPHWDMLPLEIYFQFSANLMGPASPPELQRSRRRMSIVTERGCPRQCSFCVHLGQSVQDQRRIYNDPTIKGPAVRFHSAKYVVDMVKHLRFKYQVDFVSILDENFLANKKRAYEIADLWEQEDLAGLVHFGVLGDVASADYELLQRLRDVGLTYVSYGGEVASDRLLGEIKKHTTVKQTQEAIDATMKAGVTPIVTYMTGYPTETVEDMVATVEFWKRNQMLVRPFLITPYPGTELFHEHRDRILAQHGNDIEKFLLSLGDATDLSANISPWDDATLLGLRELMVMQDADRIKRWWDGKKGADGARP